jgi:ABC-type polysaccharide/polyol phosphate transport system ATPase subunit
MTPKPSVILRGVVKEYTIHRRQATTLKEMVLRGAWTETETEPFLALKGVDLEAFPGRCLAIMGHNGSGKSTLLKLITGITEPTSGTVEISGRVAALLELGAGFQPDFTGMENIFLQCAILGLNRPQILERLDAILAFADIGDFIYTPVKHLSSGMFIRLAFAIAVHVDADILVLDEVLAVGDQAFQLRCEQRIRDLRAQGKTILFVSHDVEQVRQMADEVLWLQGGERLEYGAARNVLPHYFEKLNAALRGEATTSSDLQEHIATLVYGRHSSPEARILSARFIDRDGVEKRSFDRGEPILIEIDFEARQSIGLLSACLALAAGSYTPVVVDSEIFRDLKSGTHRVRGSIMGHSLRDGVYVVGLSLSDSPKHARVFALHLRMNALSITSGSGDMDRSRPNELLEPWGNWEE